MYAHNNCDLQKIIIDSCLTFRMQMVHVLILMNVLRILLVWIIVIHFVQIPQVSINVDVFPVILSEVRHWSTMIQTSICTWILICFSLLGDRTRPFENILNTSNVCSLTDYSSDCANGCNYPANCSISGLCMCPTILSNNSTLNLVVSSDPYKQTCQCDGHPFVYFNDSDCVNTTGNLIFTY